MFEKLKILNGKYWDIFLHEDQTVPGRIYFWYKDETLDLLNISEEAFVEFYKLGKEVKNSLIKTFNPSMFNYLALNNNTKHLHIHLVPRYFGVKEVFGLSFKDDNFGKSFKRNPEFKVPENILLQIKDSIIKNL